MVAVGAGVATALRAGDGIQRQVDLRAADRHHLAVARDVEVADVGAVVARHGLAARTERHGAGRAQRDHAAVVDLHVRPVRPVAAEHPAGRVAPDVDVFVAGQGLHLGRGERGAGVAAGRALAVCAVLPRAGVNRDSGSVVADPHPVAEVGDRLDLEVGVEAGSVAEGAGADQRASLGVIGRHQLGDALPAARAVAVGALLEDMHGAERAEDVVVGVAPVPAVAGGAVLGRRADHDHAVGDVDRLAEPGEFVGRVARGQGGDQLGSLEDVGGARRGVAVRGRVARADHGERDGVGRGRAVVVEAGLDGVVLADQRAGAADLLVDDGAGAAPVLLEFVAAREAHAGLADLHVRDRVAAEGNLRADGNGRVRRDDVVGVVFEHDGE